MYEKQPYFFKIDFYDNLMGFQIIYDALNILVYLRKIQYNQI